jgi:phosphotransferase family enzyme
MPVLERSLQSDLRPGSNLKGSAAGAAWTFLLPRLEFDHVVCWGAPSMAALATLSRLGRRVTVVLRANAAGPEDDIRRHGPTGVLLTTDNPGPPRASADLVYVTDREADGDLRGPLEALRSDGHLYLELSSYRRARELSERLQAGGHPRPFAFRLTPRDGEARSAVPADDRQLADYFRKHRLGISPSLVSVRSWRGLAGLGRSTQRTGLLMSGPAGERLRPAAYLSRLARPAGLDLAGYRCGVSARGRYSSRKVILYLFAPGSHRPALIVKTTRAPEFNARLQNEAQALADIHQRGLVPDGAAPHVLFSGTEGGLLMVAENVVEGTSLERAIGRDGGEWVEAGFEWITRLAEPSAERHASRRGELSAAMEQIIQMADALYALGAEERRMIGAAAARLGDSSLSVPVVYFHGDATVKNAMVTPAGEVAFLDWEAADPLGVALWDLFYFARSAALSGKGLRRRLAAQPVRLIRALAEDQRLARAVGVYCLRAGVSEEAVPALFQMCWLHRAVKEAARLPASRLQAGHYINLVRAVLRFRGGAAWFA